MKTYTLFLLVIILNGCSSNPFVREIDLSEEVSDQFFSITAHWAERDSILKVFVSHTIPVSAESEYQEVDFAKVTLLQRDETKDFIYIEESKFYELDNSLSLQENITINVTVDNEKQLKAEQEFPTTPINIAVTDTTQIVNADTLVRNSEFEIAIYDDISSANYYIVEMTGTGTDVIRPQLGNIERKFGIASEHPNVEYGSLNKVYITDKNANGSKLEIPIRFSSFFLTKLEKINITIRTITKEGYLFELSSDKIFESNNNPLSEPVILFNNIENGVGCFSLERRFEFEYIKQ